MATLSDARDSAQSLLSILGVTGVGMNQSENIILVYVNSSEVASRIPSDILGFPTRVIVSGNVVSF